jgi:hypothetical protein
MPKLNQLIAARPTVAAKADRNFTDLHKLVQKVEPLRGLIKTYAPVDDNGQQLPSESTKVQVKVEDVIKSVGTELTQLFDLVLSLETANAVAKADVKVDGTVIAKDVPVTYLLFLEKKLVDIGTFVAKLPVLDPGQNWNYDENVGSFAADPVKTTRSKDVPRATVLYEATDKHPAQIREFNESVLVGIWTKIDFSGAITADRKRAIMDKVEKLKLAVKFAREEANSQEAPSQNIGEKFFGFLFS